jgi:hypothetical protein
MLHYVRTHTPEVSGCPFTSTHWAFFTIGIGNLEELDGLKKGRKEIKETNNQKKNRRKSWPKSLNET